MVNRLGAMAFCIMLGFLSSAQARGFDEVDIELVSDRGDEFRQFPLREGSRHARRAYALARKGRNYSIRVRNNSSQRVALVIAVDGRNIISGEYSKLGRNEPKYVLGPYQQQEYRGWRTDKDQVNRFYFTDAGDSYAESWGDSSAMGVIAVAVYQEQRQPIALPHHKNRRFEAGAMQSAPGTGFGEEEYSPSRKVRFEAERKPSSRYFIKYEWRDSLCRRGLLECREDRGNRFWPEHQDDTPFAPYPPGRHRH